MDQEFEKFGCLPPSLEELSQLIGVKDIKEMTKLEKKTVKNHIESKQETFNKKIDDLILNQASSGLA